MLEGANPTASAISAKVIPEFWSCRMRSAHLFIPVRLRHTRSISQRHSVTELRLNKLMAETIGDRVRKWRAVRDISVETLARKTGLRPSTLYDLESGRSKSTTKLHRIAVELRVAVSYLESGAGDPETGALSTEEILAGVGWPFNISRDQFDSLSARNKQIANNVLSALVSQGGLARERRATKRRTG